MRILAAPLLFLTFLLLTAGTLDRRPPIRRGAALGKSPVVSLADVVRDPAAYADRIVTIEGKVHACCSNKGCWMELRDGRSSASVRVTFKDYAFFVPTNSAGMRARAEGVVSVRTLSRETVDHYAGEGATVKRNADGTATEVSFEATGVELRK